MKAFNDKSTVPDISEMLASWFPSTDTKKSKHKAKKKQSPLHCLQGGVTEGQSD